MDSAETGDRDADRLRERNPDVNGVDLPLAVDYLREGRWDAAP